LEDMQFVEATRMSKTEIAVLFKLPASYLGGSTGDSLTYATVESNKIQLATQAIAPVANNISQFLSHDFTIFPFQSWYCEFVLEGMLRGDSTARAQYWSTMKDVVGLDPEYIAARENIPLSAVKEPEPVPPQLVPPTPAGAAQ
jgi:phage portal protein BeeE